MTGKSSCRADSDEKNRKIAEWLGYRLVTGPDKVHTLWWRIEVDDGVYASGVGAVTWPDFYTDEAANALVLEKMRYLHLRRHDDRLYGTGLQQSAV